MKKFLFLVFLIFIACGQENPIGNWGEPPPESIWVYSLGENCYYHQPGQCVASIYKNCEHHCSDIIFLMADQVEWTVASFDGGNYERKEDCTWDYCWEQADEGIWLSLVGSYAIEIRMSRYFQCPDLSGQIDMFGCPIF